MSKPASRAFVKMLAGLSGQGRQIRSLGHGKWGIFVPGGQVEQEVFAATVIAAVKRELLQATSETANNPKWLREYTLSPSGREFFNEQSSKQ